jgi:hypothetical protein
LALVELEADGMHHQVVLSQVAMEQTQCLVDLQHLAVEAVADMEVMTQVLAQMDLLHKAEDLEVREAEVELIAATVLRALQHKTLPLVQQDMVLQEELERCQPGLAAEAVAQVELVLTQHQMLVAQVDLEDSTL